MIEKLDALLSNFKDYHIPTLIFMFCVGTAVHWLHGLDALYITFVGIIIGSLTGHAWSPAQKNGTNP